MPAPASFRWLVWVIAAIVVLGDQATKLWVQRELALWERWRPFETFPLNHLAITHVPNSGAAFGLFPQLGNVFVLIAIVVVMAIAWFYRRLPPRDGWLFLSLGLQLGGALGNLLDRLRLSYVVDFIEISIAPVFNLADVAVVLGVLLLIVWLERDGRSPAEPATAPLATDEDPTEGERAP